MLRGFIGLRRLSSDAGGGGTATPPPTGSDPGQSNAGGGDPGQAPAPASTSGEPSTPTQKTFTQAELDRKVQERLAEHTRKTEAKAAAERKAAEEKALADNAEWKTLADQRGAELEQTKAQAQAATAYAKRLNAMVDAEIAEWPEEVKGLDPGKDAIEQRLDWLEKSRPLAKRLAALPKAPATEAGAGSGTPPATPPAGQGQGTQGKTFRFVSDKDVSW
jgi:hypothetical protein